MFELDDSVRVRYAALAPPHLGVASRPRGAARMPRPSRAPKPEAQTARSLSRIPVGCAFGFGGVSGSFAGGSSCASEARMPADRTGQDRRGQESKRAGKQAGVKDGRGQGRTGQGRDKKGRGNKRQPPVRRARMHAHCHARPHRHALLHLSSAQRALTPGHAQGPTHVRTLTRMHARTRTPTGMRRLTHAQAHARTHARAHTHTRTRTLTHTHARTRTHTHNSRACVLGCGCVHVVRARACMRVCVRSCVPACVRQCVC